MQTIIASETNTGFNFCTTEFSGEIENIGYNLYHYYDEEKKIDTSTIPKKKETKDTNDAVDEKSPDVVNMYRSVKRRIEAEFYNRVYGSPEPDSPAATAARKKREETRVKDPWEVPLPEIQISEATKAMIDDCSSASSAGFDSTSDRGLGVKALQTSLTPVKEKSIPVKKEGKKANIVIKKESKMQSRPTIVTKDNPSVAQSASIKELDDLLGEYLPSRNSPMGRSRSSPVKSMSPDFSLSYSKSLTEDDDSPAPARITVTTRDNIQFYRHEPASGSKDDSTLNLRSSPSKKKKDKKKSYHKPSWLVSI